MSRKIGNNIKILAEFSGILLAWRGLWGLSDIYLFPNRPEISYFASLLIGLVILYFPDRKLNELR